MIRNALGHVRRTAKKNAPEPIQKWKVVRGDKVEVTTGKYKGQQGTVLKCLRKENKVIVEGVNMQMRLLKIGGEEKATLKKYESPIHYSNVSLVDPSLGVPTKVLWHTSQGEKVRVSKKIVKNTDRTIIFKPAILKERRSSHPAGKLCDTSSEVVLKNTYEDDSTGPNTVLQGLIQRM